MRSLIKKTFPNIGKDVRKKEYRQRCWERRIGLK